MRNILYEIDKSHQFLFGRIHRALGVDLRRIVPGIGDADRDRRAPLLTCTRLQMMALFEGRLTPEQAVQQGLLQNAAPVKELLSLLDSFRPDFQLVLP